MSGSGEVDSEFPRSLGKVATRQLRSHGLTRYDQVAAVSDSDLLARHGVGSKAVRILREELAARGLALLE